MFPVANKLPTACIVPTILDYIYYSVGTNKYVQNLVLLPDANELPDANTLGTGIQRLTLAEQDCRFRMNNERCTMIIRQQDYKSQKYICSEVNMMLSEQSG